MTQKELNQLYHLDKEIKMYKSKLEELKSMHYSSPEITGMPSSGKTSNLTGELAISIVAFEEILSDAINKRILELKKLTEYISNINDSQVRQIFHLRHVEGKTWNQIGEKMNYSFQGVYKKYKMYLEKSRKSRNTNMI